MNDNLHKNLPKVGNIQTKDFTYNLPDEKIAKYPLGQRDKSKLLLWENGHIAQDKFQNIDSLLPEHSMLVFNNTRVIQARLLFKKETGAKIEIFCLEPKNPSDYQIAFQQTAEVEWTCFVGNAKKWKEGQLKRRIKIEGEDLLLTAEMLEKGKNNYVIKFVWDKPYTFSEIIENSGIIPIPPYLNRETEESDLTRYQTVFAKIKGSVAAPTAGLHFTDEILNKISAKQIKKAELTLHVGAGTFHPVKTETIAGHNMHSETVTVSKAFISELIQHKNKVIAVGTTSVRSLESLYWLGVRFLQQEAGVVDFQISQWESYNSEVSITREEALKAIVELMESKKLEVLHFSTQIIIVPGYQFRIIDGMFTNFHQPQSTLLLLVGAFLGNDWKKVYQFALENDFRFLSYGDSNLYLK